MSEGLKEDSTAVSMIREGAIGASVDAVSIFAGGKAGQGLARAGLKDATSTVADEAIGIASGTFVQAGVNNVDEVPAVVNNAIDAVVELATETTERVENVILPEDPEKRR